MRESNELFLVDSRKERRDTIFWGVAKFRFASLVSARKQARERVILLHRGKSQRHIVIPDTDLTQCSCVCARRIVFRFPTFPSHVFDFTSAFNRPRMLLIFLPYIRRSYLRYFFPFPLFADFIWKERARSPSIPLVFLYSIHEFI